MDTITGMRTFVAVAAQKSFTGGAKRLGISTRLASKYVGQLEEKLGAQLLNRTTRSVTLTETGQAYLVRCTPILDQLDELEGLVQERTGELAGPIRITAPTGFGGRELLEALKPFQKAHPKVSISMQLSDAHLSIVEEGIDIAVRFGALADSSMMARKLLNMRQIVFASPDYLKIHGTPAHPSALSTHNCLLQRFATETTHWPFIIDGVEQRFPVSGTFEANSPRAIAQMASGGLGIGRGPIYPSMPFLKDGSLVPLFEEHEVAPLSLYAVYPPGRHLTARIRALIDHLVDYYQTHGKAFG